MLPEGGGGHWDGGFTLSSDGSQLSVVDLLETSSAVECLLGEFGPSDGPVPPGSLSESSV